MISYPSPAQRIVVIGSSGHARVVIDIVECAGTSKIVGLLDDYRSAGETTSGYNVLGKTNDLPALVEREQIDGLLVAVGDNWMRRQIVERMSALVPGLSFVTAVHPSARIARTAKVGDGSVVMANAVINSGAQVGQFCIVNTAASLDHDGEMADYSSLAPGVHTGGNVRVGAFSAISIGAVVSHDRHVGEHCVVGAGAVVVRDIPAYSVALGVPARVIRKRQAGEEYL